MIEANADDAALMKLVEQTIPPMPSPSTSEPLSGRRFSPKAGAPLGLLSVSAVGGV